MSACASVSICPAQFEPPSDAKAIVMELRHYDEALFAKPRWLVLNKLDLVPEEERAARVKAFVKALKWKGPVFAIAAVDGTGCRELVWKLQDWLDAHPAAAPAVPDTASNAAPGAAPTGAVPAPTGDGAAGATQ